MAKVNFKGLEKFAKQMNKLEDKQINQFSEAAIKELAARLLRKVILRTPVGDYSKEIEITAKRDSKNHKKGDVYTKKVNLSGKLGGTLRRGWTVGEVVKAGNIYSIEIINPVEYASYVEYGHRGVYVPSLGKTLHLNTHYTEPKYMLTISEQELEKDAPRILENKLKRFWGDIFNA